jgi:membrane-bound serine protease (ClpP class)
MRPLSPFSLLRHVLAGLLAMTVVIVLGAPAAVAHSGHEGEVHTPPAVVDVVQVQGFLDPVLVDMLADVLESLDPSETVAVVFQVDSTTSVVDNSELVRLAELIVAAPVPVSFWVGPSGAEATGPMARLVALGDDIGIAPGAHLGMLGEPVLGNGFGLPFGLPVDTDLVDRAVGYEEAIERGLARSAPVLLEQLVGVPGFEVRTVDGDDGPSVQPVTPTRFRQLDVVAEFFHTVASPAVAYLLLLIGMGLLVFELYTAGVGIAGVIGAGCFLLSTYGLGVLPARGWAVGVLVFAFVGFAIDVQAGVPRLWSIIGTIALVVGSVFLFEGQSFSWITLVVGLLGTVAGVVGGMPTMVRTRFSTPTIGREWIIGEEGTAEDELSPNGTVRVRDAVWRATTNRATPVGPGGDIRVTGVDGLWLEVEPLDGAARDYRRR